MYGLCLDDNVNTVVVSRPLTEEVNKYLHPRYERLPIPWVFSDKDSTVLVNQLSLLLSSNLDQKENMQNMLSKDNPFITSYLKLTLTEKAKEEIKKAQETVQEYNDQILSLEAKKESLVRKYGI